MVEADVELSNPSKPELKPLTVRAMVDTGAMTICIPQHVAVQLQLPEIEKREVTTADERSHVVPYVAPIQIRFENRTCFTGALVNPRSPNIPSVLVK
jgi:clan AA aspartic protease